MRHSPYVCQICGQVEQPLWDDNLEMEIYKDDLEEDDLHWERHSFEFPQCRIWLMACEECSKMGAVAMFERYQQRVRAGEIERFH